MAINSHAQPTEASHGHVSGTSSPAKSPRLSEASKPLGYYWDYGFEPPTNNHRGNNPLPILAKEYPEPPKVIDVAKQLELEPCKYSLHFDLRKAAMTELSLDDPEVKKLKLAAARKELLAMAEKI